MQRSKSRSRQSTTERLIGEAGNWTGFWDRLVSSKDTAQQGHAFERLGTVPTGAQQAPDPFRRRAPSGLLFRFTGTFFTGMLSLVNSGDGSS